MTVPEKMYDCVPSIAGSVKLWFALRSGKMAVPLREQPVSSVCHRFDPLPQVLKNVRYRSGKPLESVKVRNAIKDAQARLDGHGRLIVRSSGTEPVIRVMGEGDDKVLIEEVVDGIVDALNSAA